MQSGCENFWSHCSVPSVINHSNWLYLTIINTALQSPLTPLQLELLELYARGISAQDLQTIQQLISDYFAKKAIEEADRLWESRGYTDETMTNWLKKSGDHARGDWQQYITVSISSKSRFHPIYKAMLNGALTLCVSNSILEEYEEVVGVHWNAIVADNVINSILKSPHVQFIDPRFNWLLISADPDDNKFVDCAIAANALYLATDDKHYKLLKTLPFPPVNIIDLEAFLALVPNLSPQK